MVLIKNNTRDLQFSTINMIINTIKRNKYINYI